MHSMLEMGAYPAQQAMDSITDRLAGNLEEEVKPKRWGVEP